MNETETPLPTNTTDRLRVVAAAIERHHENWDQTDFIHYDDDDVDTPKPWKPVGVVGSGVPTCGTTLCVAGWGVVLSPDDGKITDRMGWEQAGAVALGFDIDLAEYIFYQIGEDSDESDRIRLDMPTVLRSLAEIPEGERSRDNSYVRDILEVFEQH